MTLRNSLAVCCLILALAGVGSVTASNLNLPMKTLGGKQLWADQRVLADWRIQKSVLTDHYRLLSPDDVRVAWGTFEEVEKVWQERTAGFQGASSLKVLLIHGLGRSRGSMQGLKEGLEAQGFHVETVQYPSTRLGLKDHALQVSAVIGHWEVEEVVIVTHSLGALVTRKMLESSPAWREKIKLRSIVMIAPPSTGAAISDYLQRFSLFEAVMGKAGLNTTSEQAVRLTILDVPFAVIAGGKGDNSGYNPLLAGDDDGVVRVEETHLSEEKDFLLVDAIHSFVMNKPETITAVTNFIRNESFEP